MNDPQFWGLVRGLLIALGGILTGLGVLTLTVQDWAVLVDKTIAFLMAATGLAAIIAPMVRGWMSRSKAGLVTETSKVLKPGELIAVEQKISAAVPSDQVISPEQLAAGGAAVRLAGVVMPGMPR